MNTNMEITYLSGGDAIFGPNYGGATVLTIMRKGIVESRPNVTRLLQNMTFTLAMENEMMRLILDEKLEPRTAAHQWLSDRCQTTVLEFDRPARSADHPTMKPVALFEYLIGNSVAAYSIIISTFFSFLFC